MLYVGVVCKYLLFPETNRKANDETDYREDSEDYKDDNESTPTRATFILGGLLLLLISNHNFHISVSRRFFSLVELLTLLVGQILHFTCDFLLQFISVELHSKGT